MDSLTASNISEILNNNIKELTNNKTIFTSLVENIYLVIGVIVLLLSFVGYYFYNNLKLNKEKIDEELKNSHKQLLEQQQINNKLVKKNYESQFLINQQKQELEKRVVEGIDNNDSLNVVHHEEPIEEEYIEEEPIEEEIEINTDDIIKNIEYLEDTDSEQLEDQNVRDLNLSVQEMEQINNTLFR